MKLTFLITVDPVKSIEHLNLLVHSLNLQTCPAFNVVFYNQTRYPEADILRALHVRPQFEFSFCGVPKEDFLGAWPLWDLYAVHAGLLESGRLQDYLMSLHMEEFLDVDYVEQALQVLARNRFDILLGNLTRTPHRYEDVGTLLAATTPGSMATELGRRGFQRCCHWAFHHDRWVLHGLRHTPALTLARAAGFGFRRKLRPTRRGYTRMRRYLAEDVYFMRTDFARRTNWFLRGHAMYMEDIHVCEQPGVCELARELSKMTAFPVYFNRSRVYHLEHGKFYYQFEDEEFRRRMLARQTEEPVLVALQEAIRGYESGRMSLPEALAWSRQNPAGTGTQNLNYRYHMQYLQSEPR